MIGVYIFAFKEEFKQETIKEAMPFVVVIIVVIIAGGVLLGSLGVTSTGGALL
jgi:hypothetical protein